MFLLMGGGNHQEKSDFTTKEYCSKCRSIELIEFYVEYSYFSIFFIKLFKWNKKYIMLCKGCNQYEYITKEEYESAKKTGKIGDKLKDIHSNPQSYAENGDNNFTDNENVDKYTQDIKCVHCGFVADTDYIYCPKCGNKL